MPHRHGPLVWDPHKGWQCDTCGDWLPLDYKGPDTRCGCNACDQYRQAIRRHLQHAVPASQHKQCECGAVYQHCNCMHNVQAQDHCNPDGGNTP